MFYTKDFISHSKTTKAFNPIHYKGVKRSYKEACRFALQMMNRKINSASDFVETSEEISTK